MALPVMEAKTAATPAARRPIVGFLVAFACVFTGLALLHGIGPTYTGAHAALGNALFGRRLASGTTLQLRASEAELAADPWHATLRVVPLPPEHPLEVPIDVRSLLFLPTAAFLALAIAAPLRSVREHLQLIAVGLLILEPLLLFLIATPLLSFLGGTGPVHAFTLSRPTHVLLQVLYRALVTPPGMAFAIPLLVWWGLLTALSRRGRRRNANAVQATPY
ncbi:MAG: hypothetical protein WDO74_31830 [Pseudomonadota bacterium]